MSQRFSVAVKSLYTANFEKLVLRAEGKDTVISVGFRWFVGRRKVFEHFEKTSLQTDGFRPHAWLTLSFDGNPPPAGATVGEVCFSLRRDDPGPAVDWLVLSHACLDAPPQDDVAALEGTAAAR